MGMVDCARETARWKKRVQGPGIGGSIGEANSPPKGAWADTMCIAPGPGAPGGTPITWMERVRSPTLKPAPPAASATGPLAVDFMKTSGSEGAVGEKFVFKMKSLTTPAPPLTSPTLPV